MSLCSLGFTLPPRIKQQTETGAVNVVEGAVYATEGVFDSTEGVFDAVDAFSDNKLSSEAFL